MLSDVMLRERAAESQVGKFLREEKKLDNIRGNAGIDIWGNRVRSELYLLKPASNKLRAMLLTYREERMDYSWVLTTYKKDLPPSFELKEPALGKDEIEYEKKLVEFNDLAWGKVSTDRENYATKIEFYASNEKDYIKETYNDGFLHYNGNDNYYELRFRNYKRVINDITKAEMELLLNETEFYNAIPEPGNYDPSEIKWTFAGGARTVDESYSFPRVDISNKVNIGNSFVAKITYGDGTWENWKNIFYSMKDKEWGASELIYEATEFEGRKIDLVSGGYSSMWHGPGDLFDLTLPYVFSPGPGYLSFLNRGWGTR
jgi:hypothetical protein